MSKIQEWKERARKRLSTCRECEHYKPITRRCGVCGCFVEVKARIPYFQCPEGKWEVYDKEDPNLALGKIPI